MSILFVVDNEGDWPIRMPGVQVVSARAYLGDPAFSAVRAAKVFNLCRSYRYQRTGYYVSLLASARGHKPLPDVTTIQDLKSQSMIRVLSEDLDELIQKSLHPIQSDAFTLSIYFGRGLARRHERLCLRLFNQFQAPLLRAVFTREHGRWELRGIRPIAANDIPAEHHQLVVEYAEQYFAGRRRPRSRNATRYDLAILHDPEDSHPPSNARALKKFGRAAERLGMDVKFITRDDYARLAEFDALFIRATTFINRHPYRFSRRAAAEGLVVVDDPQSIVRCSNKVYLAERLERNGVPTPRTLVVHRGNVDEVLPKLGLPCVLKQPDSAFSRGVIKVESAGEFVDRVGALLEKSDLVLAQEFVPTEFDWRVGVFGGEALYVCQYFMARRHWQVVRRDGDGRTEEGHDVTLRVEDAPPEVIKTALKAANLIGNGLYGVDLKQIGRRVYVIEVNDNPNIDAGIEDRILKDELYRRIMQGFLARIEQRKNPKP